MNRQIGFSRGGAKRAALDDVTAQVDRAEQQGVAFEQFGAIELGWRVDLNFARMSPLDSDRYVVGLPCPIRPNMRRNSPGRIPLHEYLSALASSNDEIAAGNFQIARECRGSLRGEIGHAPERHARRVYPTS